MNEFLAKCLRNLRRPLPELYGYLAAKVLSAVWRIYVARVGRKFHVSRGTRIQGGASISIGDSFFAGPGLWIEAVRRYRSDAYEPRIVIGSGVTCSDFVHIAATTDVNIGDGVLMGSHVHVTDHAHGVYSGADQDDPRTPPVQRRLSIGRPVRIGANSWLGDGVVVLPGVTIGDGTIVGANSVVTRDLPAQVMAVGAPARPIKHYDDATRSWIAIANET